MISDSKTYTHAVNLNGPDVTINGVLFASGTNGANWANWDMYRASQIALQTYNFSSSAANVSGAGTNLLLNFFHYPSTDSGAVIIDGLTADMDYIFTIYGMGFDTSGDRASYFATSDGAAITNLAINQFGQHNGIRVTHRFTAPANGIYTVSATPIDNPWHWYAFSNEPIPEPALFGLIILGVLALVRKK